MEQSENDKCISKCYRENLKEERSYFIHPLLGLYSVTNDVNSYCIGQYLMPNSNNMQMKCTKSVESSNDIVNALNIPIKPNNYIQLYYSFNCVNDVIKHFQNNTNILLLSKNRIVDFALIGFKDTFDNDIDKWTELIKISFQNEYNENRMTDEIILKIFKKIFKKNEIDEKYYPFNLLLKFKKFLDYNI